MGLSLRHVSVLLMLFTYLVGGAPRAASSASRSGLTQWRLLFLHLSDWICSFMRNLLDLIAYSIDTYLWSRSLWHDTCTRVRPCNADKSEWPSSGRGSPARRHLTRPSVPQSLPRSDKGWLATVMTGLVSLHDWCAGPTPGATLGTSRAVSPSLRHGPLAR